MENQICYWKGVSESSSPEANAMKSQTPSVRFDFCKNYCNGTDISCRLYEVRRMTREEPARVGERFGV